MPAGYVASFDDQRGHGTIVDDDGREWFFHAVAVADGSRTIRAGERVEFELVPGLLGRWEAAAIRPVS